MVLTGLKTAVETLQERMDSLAAELKRVLAGITTGINKQGELIKEIKSEMKDIKHACNDNSSRSSTSSDK